MYMTNLISCINRSLKRGDNVFGKIITDMITPFDQDDNINLESVKKLVEHLLKNNTSAILLCEATGESPTLSDIEKMILIEKVLEYVGKRIPVIAGIGSNSTKKTVEFMKKLEHLPLAGYLIVVPYYNIPDQEGIFEHFKTIAAQTKKVILIYNIPERTGIDIDIEIVKRLAEIKNIIGIVDSSKSIAKLIKLKEEINDFKVYSGNDLLIYDALKNNADGIVSIASHIYGKSIHHIAQLIRTRQYDDALAIFDIYLPKFQSLMIKPNPVPLKAALNKLGFNVGSVRLPLLDMNDEIKAKLYNILGV